MSSNSAIFGGAAFIAATLLSLAYNKVKTSKCGCCTPKPESKSKDFVVPRVNYKFFFEKDSNREAYVAECKKVADAFNKFGVIAVENKDVLESDNNTFLDMMERYFEQSDGVRDARPNYHYQVGVTPDGVELPRNHCKLMGAYGPDDKPLSVCPPEKDPKWRFFWRIGSRPTKTDFPDLNADPVIPPEFPEWRSTMDMWGGKMLASLFILAEMLAVGLDLPADTFTKKMNHGPHLLAPTGSNFNRFGQKGTVLAGFHYDLNFMTIHGKSRFPGLFVWTREGAKVPVVVPDGCLLVQAGKQLEYLTGGHVLAGFHEVVVTDQTLAAIDRRRANNQSLWRVSSTLFGHIQSDQLLGPLPPFDTEDARKKWENIPAGKMVQKELETIALLSPGSVAAI